MNRLKQITIRGFKSLNQVNQLKLDDVTILIGPNGSGKSNFIDFFKMLNWMTSGKGNLQTFVSKSGGAHSLLFDGPKTTKCIEAQLQFASDQGINEYHMKLKQGPSDSLVFEEEKYRYSSARFEGKAEWTNLGFNHRELQLLGRTDPTARYVLGALRKFVVYQFHNTSDTARMRNRWNLEDDSFLKRDGANIAPFLYRLKRQRKSHFERISDCIRRCLPFFDEFFLDPDGDSIGLRWREKESGYILGPHQASDGMLRTICLATLFLQPEEWLPSVMIIDEPEMGLHPFAINTIIDLIKEVSANTQVIIATQSPSFVDRFDADQLVTVQRKNRETIFDRLDMNHLQHWMHTYNSVNAWLDYYEIDD